MGFLIIARLQWLDIRGLLRQIRLVPHSARVSDPAVLLNVRLLCSLLDRPTSLAAFPLHPFPPRFLLPDVLSFVSGIRLDSRRLGFRARLFFLRSVLNNRLACLFHPCG